MNYLNLYVGFLKRFLRVKTKVKVIFDCSNGSTGLVLKPLLGGQRRISHSLINSRPDGRFPGHGPDPLKRGATKELQRKVVTTQADLGVVFDGDGDRVLFIDNRGRKVSGDAIARLLINYLQPKKVVVEVRTGWLVRKGVKAKIYKSPVGRYYLRKMMISKGAALGAELSGHYYFRSFYYYDSGILGALEVIKAVSYLKKNNSSLSRWLDSLPPYYSLTKNLTLKNQEKALAKVSRYFRGRYKNLDFQDGLTLETPSFWFNLRASKTEPVVRLTLEAKSQDILEKESKRLRELLH